MSQVKYLLSNMSHVAACLQYSLTDTKRYSFFVFHDKLTETDFLKENKSVSNQLAGPLYIFGQIIFTVQNIKKCSYKCLNYLHFSYLIYFIIQLTVYLYFHTFYFPAWKSKFSLRSFARRRKNRSFIYVPVFVGQEIVTFKYPKHWNLRKTATIFSY